MSVRRAGLGLGAALALVVVGVGTGTAQTPQPLSFGLFPFPGAAGAPVSGTSAGVALADRWLADEPSGNPAVAAGFHVTASPTVLRVNRQDLASHNRSYSETGAFFDGAGLTIGLPGFGPFAGALYVSQPVLRFEDTAYIQGLSTPGPAPPPASIATHASMRETRAGAALATSLGALRVGLGVEWTRREDQYRRDYHGGSMDDGTTQVGFTGGVLGGQAGVRYDRGDSAVGACAIGAAIRVLPAMTVTGTESIETLSQSSEQPTSARRSGGIEAGVSARVLATPTFRALASFGGRSSQRWDGYGLAAGSGWEWKLGGEFHDPREPWSLRFGAGMEREDGVPEPRAGVFALGFGWRFDDATVDFGLTHRTIARAGLPNSFDDRVVASVRVPR